jgi:adenylate cyclase class 2
MRAGVVNCEVLALMTKDRYQLVGNLNHSGLAFDQVLDSANGMELHNECPLSGWILYHILQEVAMIEVEMKFPVSDLAGLERKLAAWGAGQAKAREEEDHYFNAPDRDFARTDEALRLRRVGLANFLTYKGPKLDQHTKTRTEIEVPLAPGEEAAEAMSQLVMRLGYHPVAVVRKARRVFRTKKEGFDLEFCLDEVTDVGRFAELEILASEERLDEARRVLQASAAELGLTGSERRSYLELLLQKKKP